MAIPLPYMARVILTTCNWDDPGSGGDGVKELELFSPRFAGQFSIDMLFEHFADVFFVHFCEHEELL